MVLDLVILCFTSFDLKSVFRSWHPLRSHGGTQCRPSAAKPCSNANCPASAAILEGIEFFTKSLRRVRVLPRFATRLSQTARQVLSTLALALELFCPTADWSAALGAYPVKNIGNDVFTCLRHCMWHPQFSSLDSRYSLMQPAHSDAFA